MKARSGERLKENLMNYEYKFVEVSAQRGLKAKTGDTFEACKEVIAAQTEAGWRLKQVVVPFNEKTGVYGATGYQIIFEKERDAQ